MAIVILNLYTEYKVREFVGNHSFLDQSKKTTTHLDCHIIVIAYMLCDSLYAWNKPTYCL